MKDFTRLVVKAAFFFIVGVLLAALFAWSFIEGYFAHSEGDGSKAMVLYIIAFVAGISAVYNYLQALTNFRFAKLS